MERDTGEIIVDILKNNKDCYAELWDKVEGLVYSIAYNHCMKHDFTFDDVKQNAYIAWKSLTDSFSLNKMQGDNIEANYISYLNKYLPKRLYDYTDKYSLFQDFRVMSYDQFSSKGFLSDDLTSNDLSTTLEGAEILTIENNLHRLTEREEDVYFLLKRGYRQVDIANKLDLARSTVYVHKENLFSKIKDILSEH